MKPQTLTEWELYIKRLAGEPLRSKVIQANTQRFASLLQKEGMTLQDVERILLFFVRQLIAVGMMLPAGGAYDLEMMALTDSVAQRGMTFSVEQAEALAQQVPDEVSDDFESLAT